MTASADPGDPAVAQGVEAAPPVNGEREGVVRPPEPPDEYIDPISQELMLDPVLLVETGQSYDRTTIEAWFARCGEGGRPCTDPLTRAILTQATVVPNYSLRSLVNTWAARHRIQDLPTYSKQVAVQRSKTHRGTAAAADAAAAVAEELARVQMSDAAGGGRGASRQADSPACEPGSNNCDGEGGGKSSVLYPDLGLGGTDQAGWGQQENQQQQQGRQQTASSSVAPAVQGVGARLEQDPVAGVGQPLLYPSAHQPAPPVDKRQAAEAALTALRAAASHSGGGGSEGAAAYHAWSLMQLAGDAEGRELLWEGNAIPLAIFALGQPPEQQQQQSGEAGGLEAAKPSLCGVLQRMGARDAGVASSIAQCGGLQALVSQLTADAAELRTAAARALYFLGWQGPELRASILEALSLHAVACRLPGKPLLALWRFWEPRPAEEGATSQADGSLFVGREAEWEALALLLHMLSEGCASSGTSVAAAGGQTAAQQQLVLLDVSASAVPAVLAHGAAAGEAPAERFAAAAAAKTLAALPSNLPLLLEAALREGSLAGASAAASAADGVTATSNEGGEAVAGQACGLAWDLCYNRANGTSLPAAVAAVQQQTDLLLDALEAALGPGQKPEAEGKWLAAGLLACLMFEPAQHATGSGGAAVADGMRALLASQPASLTLGRLVGLMAVGDAMISPQAATMAALAVANMAAYRGSAQSPAVSPRVSLAGTSSSRLARTGGSGGFGSGSYSGSGNHGGAMAVAAHDSSVGRLAAKAVSRLSAAIGKQQPSSPAAAASPEGGAGQQPAQQLQQQQQQPTDPRGALLHHGAMLRLLRLVISSHLAAAKAAAAAAATAAGSSSGGLTPAARQAGIAAAAAASEAAAVQRRLLSAALQALNNLCVEPAAASNMRSTVKQSGTETALDLKEALNAAMSDRQLSPATREYARRLSHTQSGAPGQLHSLACSCPVPSSRAAVYPNP